MSTFVTLRCEDCHAEEAWGNPSLDKRPIGWVCVPSGDQHPSQESADYVDYCEDCAQNRRDACVEKHP